MGVSKHHYRTLASEWKFLQPNYKPVAKRNTMPVRDLGGSRLVVRLPDEKKLTNKQKKYLEPRLNESNSDGEIWVLFDNTFGHYVGEEYKELLELGFKGKDDSDPDMYSVPFARDVEIPWAHMVKAKYTDDNFPWMSLLWVMKNSLNWTFEDRPFRIATEEEYVAQMAWLNEKDKPNNVLPFAKVTKKVNINTLIRGSAGKPKTKPEGFLRISVLMTWITCDPDGKSRNSNRPVSGDYCQLISSVGNSISKGPKPDFKFEAQGVAHELIWGFFQFFKFNRSRGFPVGASFSYCRRWYEYSTKRGDQSWFTSNITFSC